MFDNKAFNTLVEGDPGSGKTFLALHNALAWVKNIPEYSISEKVLVIFIQPREVKETLDKTIMAALKGTQSMKRKMFYFWKNYPELCCIILDALDEICNEVELLKEIFDFMNNKACFFVVTCRTNSIVLDERRNHFQRTIKVEGFDNRDAVVFTERFLKDGDGLLSEAGKAICKSLNQSDRLCGLFCNPMVACLSCILVAEDRMSMAILNELSVLNLYQKVEELLLLRNGTEVTDALQDDLNRLHQLALWSILVNKVTYTAEELEEFGLSPTSCVVTQLLRKGRGTAWDSFHTRFYWIHRSFLEYSAAKAFNDYQELTKKLLICYVASRRELSHLAYMLASLFRDDQEMLVLLTRATLAFQTPLFEEEDCSDMCTRRCRRYLSHLNVQNIVLGKKSKSNACGPDEVHPPDFSQPCECSHIDVKSETALHSYYQASRLILCGAPELTKSLSRATLEKYTPAIL